MRKIVSLFQRNYDGNRLVRNEVVPGAEWVLAGEGVATRKFDGTCCLLRDGVLYKRFDAKSGKIPPIGFEPAQDPDPVTGHWPGWVRIGAGPEDQYFREALANTQFLLNPALTEYTCELCGPKVQGNPEHFERHVLVLHGGEQLEDCPRTFDGIREFLTGRDIEGIVWHHPDGRMVKIKAKDYGIKRGSR